MMLSVEEEFSEIEADWFLKYLETTDTNHRYVIEVAKEGVTLKVCVPGTYPDEYLRFEFCEITMKGIDQEMKQSILRTTYKNMGPRIGKPMIKCALEDIWKQLKSAMVEESVKKTDSFQEPAKRSKQKKKTRYHMAAQFGVLPRLRPQHGVMQVQSWSEKESAFPGNVNAKKAKKWQKKMSPDKKAPPMKTARDVINRLKWDDQLKNLEFAVGYSDRFKGTIEVPVFDLNWEDDIAATGPNDKLAIPEHRIEYFKWNSVLVWEKITRTDHVFGSTGSKTDIVEFIKRWKQREQETRKEVADSIDAGFTEAVIAAGVKADDEFQDAAAKEESKEAILQQGNAAGSLQKTLQIVQVEDCDPVVKATSADVGEMRTGVDFPEVTEPDIRPSSEPTESAAGEAVYIAHVLNGNSPHVATEDGRPITGDDSRLPDITASADVGETPIGVDLEIIEHDLRPSSEPTESAAGRLKHVAQDVNETSLHVATDGRRPITGDDELLSDITSIPEDSEAKPDDGVALVMEGVLLQVESMDISSPTKNVTEENAVPEEFQQLFCGELTETDENCEDLKRPDMNSCPKVPPERHQFRQADKPYSGSFKGHGNNRRKNDRRRNDKKHHSRDRDGRDRGSRSSQSEYFGDRWTGRQYCLAVDVGTAPKILRRFHDKVKHWNILGYEPYLFVNIGTCTIEAQKDERLLQQTLEAVCEGIDPFEATLSAAFVSGGNLRADLEAYSFSNLFENIGANLGNKQSEYNFILDPHIQFATVREGQSCGGAELSGKTLRITSLYLWRLGDDYQQPQIVRLGQPWRDERRGSKRPRYSHHEGKGLLEKKRVRNGQETYNSEWETTVSKKLAAVLRHNCMGFQVDEDGFLDVKDLLLHQFFKKLRVEQEDIEYIVQNNAKKRFAFEQHSGKRRIRANQGHTVEVQSLHLKEITQPEEFPVVVHGTSLSVLDSIARTGLQRMRRNHIHMTTALPRSSEQVISGMRNSSNCFIFINIQKAMEDGIKFFLSENGVILSEGKNGVLHPKYISHVRGRNGKTEYDIPRPELDLP